MTQPESQLSEVKQQQLSGISPRASERDTESGAFALTDEL
jgi:hypothetical protein